MILLKRNVTVPGSPNTVQKPSAYILSGTLTFISGLKKCKARYVPAPLKKHTISERASLPALEAKYKYNIAKINPTEIKVIFIRTYLP